MIVQSEGGVCSSMTLKWLVMHMLGCECVWLYNVCMHPYGISCACDCESVRHFGRQVLNLIHV